MDETERSAVKSSNLHFATQAIHVGQEPDAKSGAIIPPIYMTSTFLLNEPGVTKEGFDYTRSNNPNFVMLEKLLASLEGADFATVFSSGLGALTGMISMLSSGDQVLAIDGVYGGTYRLFTRIFQKFGIKFKSIMPKSLKELEDALKEKPKWLFFETPTNPLLEIFDIKEFASLAKKHGVLCVVDNTFATPYLQNPLALGADIVWHSTTKYIGGHSDVIGGVAITNHSPIKEALDFARKSMGLNPSPFDVWLTTRGVKTLAVRMDRHNHNAMLIANYLSTHPRVKKVYYPGLASHPNHELAKKQMKGFGGIISAEFHGSLEETREMIGKFHLFALAESLGGVESLVNHPALMTHASVPAEERHKIGITDGLIRFSVGIEAVEDLITDLQRTIS